MNINLSLAVFLILGLALGLFLGYNWGYNEGKTINTLQIGPNIHIRNQQK